jgi:hypothetical protein
MGKSKIRLTTNTAAPAAEKKLLQQQKRAGGWNISTPTLDWGEARGACPGAEKNGLMEQELAKDTEEIAISVSPVLLRSITTILCCQSLLGCRTRLRAELNVQTRPARLIGDYFAGGVST